MRRILIIAFSLPLFTLQAQTEEATSPPRASIAFQATFDYFGGFAEVYLKPKVSVWTSLNYYQVSRELGFGEDTTRGTLFRPALETMYFENVQQSMTLRSGVRFYQQSKKRQWLIWYSPIVGFSNLTAPPDEYIHAYQREDLHYLSELIGRLKTERELELGGEVGTRWMFWRKPQTNTGLFLEGSAFLLGGRSLIEKNATTDFASLELRASIGFVF